MAATAKTQLKKETEWMRRQPKARSTKSKTREAAFYELSKVARSGPKKDVKANFGDGSMMRQVCDCESIKASCSSLVISAGKHKHDCQADFGDHIR